MKKKKKKMHAKREREMKSVCSAMTKLAQKREESRETRCCFTVV